MKSPTGGKVRERVIAQNWCNSNTDSYSLDERRYGDVYMQRCAVAITNHLLK